MKTLISKKKKILLSLTLLLISLYSIAWYFYASYIKEKLVQQIPQTGPYSLTYSDIKLAGFPFHVGISLQNPNARINLAAFGQDIFSKNPVALEELQKSSLDLNISSDGPITLVSDLLTKRFKLSHTGSLQYVIKSEDKEISFNSKTTDDVYRVNFKEPLFLSDKIKNEEKHLNVAKMLPIEFVEISEGNSQITDTNKNQLLASSDAMKISFLLKDTNATEGRAEFILNSKNSTTTEEFDVFYNAILELPYIKIIQKLSNSSFPKASNWAAYGSRNADLHIIYTGTTDLDPVVNKNFQGNFEIKNYSSTNKLSTGNMTGNIGIKVDAAGLQKFSVLLHTEGNIYKDLNGYLENYITTREEELNDIFGKQSITAIKLDEKSAEKHAIETRKTIKKIQENVAILLPKFYEFGLIRQDIDIQYDRAVSEKFLIKKFDNLTDLYGLKVSGEMEKTPTSPAINGKLEIINYAALINDATSYYANIVSVFKTPENNMLSFKPGFAEALKAALQKLSDTPNANEKNITISLVSDGKNLPKIGSMQLPEAMILMQSLTPYIEQPGTSANK